MASQTINLINSIDAAFPVAGQNNDSQGFRANFNLIKTALLNAETAIEALQTQLGQLGANTINVNTLYVTGTHISAVSDLTVGGTNVITVGDNFNTVISANGYYGSVAMVPNTVSVQITGALTDFPGNTTGNSFGVTSSQNIKIGSTTTFSLSGNTIYTVTGIANTTSIVTVTPSFTIPSFALNDTVTFTNPFSGNNSVGQIAAAAANLAVSNAIPIGIISLWYGSVATIPTGWSLCNGQTVNGKVTPDLRDRFVVGASVDNNGAANTTVTGANTLSGGTKDAVVVQHNHTASGSAVSTVSDPGHKHRLGNLNGWASGQPSLYDPNYGAPGTGDTASAATGITVSTTVSVAVDNNGESGVNKNLPPYYALCYIMKTT